MSIDMNVLISNALKSARVEFGEQLNSQQPCVMITRNSAETALQALDELLDILEAKPDQDRKDDKMETYNGIPKLTDYPKGINCRNRPRQKDREGQCINPFRYGNISFVSV